MKVYNQIGLSRLLNIRVIKDDVETLYEGMVEEAPEDIKNLKYSKIQTTPCGVLLSESCSIVFVSTL